MAPGDLASGLLGGPDGDAPQVGEEGLNFELKVSRQSPPRSPVEHANLVRFAIRSNGAPRSPMRSDGSHSSGGKFLAI
jgi:hypothetical protein